MGDREAELATLALKEFPEGNHLSVATASARIVVSCLNTCRSWRRISIIAILTLGTLKELARRWKPEIRLNQTGTHQAMDDIRESVAELAYYREHFIKL